MRIGRVFVAAIAVVAGLAVAAPAAHAGTVGTTDAIGDNYQKFDPRGDIVAAWVTHDAVNLTAAVQTLQFDDPATSPHWATSSIRFTFTASNGTSDILFMSRLAPSSDPATPVTARLVNRACEGWTSWNAAARIYYATIPLSCIGAPASVSGNFLMNYSTNVGLSQDATATLTTSAPPPPPAGYRMVSANGTVHNFGAGGHYGNWQGENDIIVDIEPTPTGLGYWLLSDTGTVQGFGDAMPIIGPTGMSATASLVFGETATALSRTPSGQGYWIFTNKGRAFTFGNAKHFGDMTGVTLNGPVLDAVPTPTGQGYYMVASDGGIFSFGDARFYGSMGGKRLNAPVMSLVPDADSAGYWLVASDGGVFAFEASFRGSMGGTQLNRPVTGMVPNGNGYLMVGEDGGIFNFSDKPFFGSLGANPPASRIVSVALAS